MRTIIFLLFFLSMNTLLAQQAIGIKHDVSGMPLNGYYDPLNFSARKSISKTHYGESFEKGHYYAISGEKTEGMIKFKDKKITFKTQGKNREVLRPGEVDRFIIGVDSFFSVNQYYQKNKLKTKPIYVQYISQFGEYTLVKHYHSLGVINGNMLEIKYLIKSTSEDVWTEIADDKSFKGEALKYFGHIPYLKQKIESAKYGFKDMLSIVKMAEYQSKFENKKPIYYDQYWQEINNPEQAVYQSNIINKTDSIWTFEYRNNDQKLYEVSYSSFYPHLKNGDFIAYYPSGKTRLIAAYKDNKAKSIKLFTSNGLLKTHYLIKENETKKKTSLDITYITVNDASGQNILKAQGPSVLTAVDESSGQEYVSVFEDYRLQKLYRIMDQDTVFQINDPNYDFKIQSLQNRFNTHMMQKTYDQALSENAQGPLLVSMVIDRKGLMTDYKFLNQIHPELDKIVKEFIDSYLSHHAYSRFKFRPYRRGKSKEYCEIVIPFEFNISRIYRRPVKYNHFNDAFQWHMQQHMNFHNQTIQNLPKFNAPSGF